MSRPAAAVVAVLVLRLTIVAVRTVVETPRTALRAPLREFPMRLAGWRGSDEFFDPTVLSGLRVDDYLLRQYQSPSQGGLWLYVAYYGSQPTDTRVHSPAVCLPGAGWTIIQSSRMPIAVPRGVTAGPAAAPSVFDVNRVLIQKGEDRQLVLYWYQIHGRVAARELNAISLLAWTAFTEHATDEALVRINAPIVGSVGSTTAREVAFVRAMSPALRELLPGK
jgi:EpsI family protein